MIRKNILTIGCVLAVLIMQGCGTNPEIFEIGPDTYTVTTVGDTGFVSLGKLKSEAYRQAEEKARQQGKVIEVISVNEVPAGFAKWPQVEVRFRLLSKELVESRTGGLKNRSLQSIGQNADGNVTSVESIRQIDSTKDEQKSHSRYRKLKEIGELKNSGVLTEAEFEKEKQRILQQE